MRLIDADELGRYLFSRFHFQRVELEDVIAAMADFADKNTIEAEPMQKWISVKDRLPEYDTRVIACCTDGHVASMHAYGKWFYECGIITDNVTHWMPLPEPPKEGRA